MRYDAAHIQSVAQQYASNLGFAGIGKIPVEHRDAAAIGLARQLGITKTEVKVALAHEWNETSGKQGLGLSGGNIASASRLSARDVGGLQQVSIHFFGLDDEPAVPKSGPPPIRGAAQVDKALKSAGEARIADLPPTGFGQTMLRRGAALDKTIPGVPVGSYGAIDPTKLAKDDPVLDAPIFRGMSSQDPTVHALLLTGRMIPQGRGSDYEGFKRYDHKDALDAYEWSFDPYVALKATGGHGYLVRTTLREMMAQGKVEAARKVGDSEGGIFISSLVQPTVRMVGHLDGAYELAHTNAAVTHPKAEPFANALAKQVPNAGGWDEFIASGAGTAKPLLRARLGETKKQIDFWIERLLERDPANTLPAKVRARMDAIPDEELGKKLSAGRNCIANLKMRYVDLEDPNAYAY